MKKSEGREPHRERATETRDPDRISTPWMIVLWVLFVSAICVAAYFMAGIPQ